MHTSMPRFAVLPRIEGALSAACLLEFKEVGHQ